MGNFTKAIALNEIPPGGGKMVSLDGQDIAFFKVNETVYAIENTCVHRGGPLAEGFLDDKVVTCPWHGWQYDVTTGISPANPDTRVKSFPVKIEGSDVWIEI